MSKYLSSSAKSEAHLWDIEHVPFLIALGTILGDYSLKIFEIVAASNYYASISKVFPGDKLDILIKMRIAKAICPYIRELLISRRSPVHDPVWLPNSGIYLLLREIWPANEIPVTDDHLRSFKLEQAGLLKHYYKRYLSFQNYFLGNCFWRYFGRKIKQAMNPGPRVAVRYFEGLDLQKRSDLGWFLKSGIGPDRILCYFDSSQNIYGQSIEEDLRKLQQIGIEPVFLVRPPSLYKGIRRWRMGTCDGPPIPWKLPRPSGPIETWIYRQLKEILPQVSEWRSFFQAYNIKILVNCEQASPNAVMQGLALDLLGNQGGLVFGKQRSDLGGPEEMYVGHHTKDVQFVWNERSRTYFKRPYNSVRSMIVTGFSNDCIFDKARNEGARNKKHLQDHGAKFIVALFDSGHRNNQYFSSDDMEAFYRAFLQWVLEDASIGLVIKSKKSYIIKTLPAIHALLARAEATGRCLRLTNEFGRLPSDASNIADLAVGYSISSPVTEAVIGGCRGIHYMEHYPRSQDYYKWGYGRLVFDDLQVMMRKLKSFVADPLSSPDLGDWHSHIDQLDPFRDGSAEERMGSYISWCLEGFEKGLDRISSQGFANQKYREVWGRDSSIEIEEGKK